MVVMMSTLLSQNDDVPEDCKGCCYRLTCNFNHKNCPYLCTGRCTINEYKQNYLFKF